MLADRAAVAARYAELLAGVDVEPPLADDADHVRSWFVYVVKLPEGCDREAVIAALERDGIATSRYLPSIHLQPYMRERYGFAEGLCPVSEATSRRTLALPFFPQLEREDQERVVDVPARRARLAVDISRRRPRGRDARAVSGGGAVRHSSRRAFGRVRPSRPTRTP